MDTEQNLKQNLEFSQGLCGREAKTSFSARFCAYFQILRSLPDSAKNSAGAESQNPGGTRVGPHCLIMDGSVYSKEQTDTTLDRNAVELTKILNKNHLLEK